MRAVDTKRKYPHFSAAALVLACVATGCRAILGLDEPTLDTCASGCSDGETADATVDDDAQVTADSGLDLDGDAGGDADSIDDGAVALDGSRDARLEAEAGPVLGLQCGAASNATYCTAEAPVCCRISGDGSVAYSCVVGVAQCQTGSDYAILCSGTNTCGATQVCCHFNSSMKCETAKDCQKGGGDRVCDPSLPADCGDASACTRPISALPYFACSP